MKKWICIFNIFVMVYFQTKSIDISTVIDVFEANSNYIKMEKLDYKKYYTEKEGILINRKRKIKNELNLKNNFTDRNENEYLNEVMVYNGEIEANLSYNDFFIGFYIKHGNNNIVYEEDIIKIKKYKSDLDSFNVGWKKVLNDYWYSQEKYEDNNLVYKKKILDYSTKYNRIEEIKKIIDIYSEIINNKIEIEINEDLEKEHKIMYNVLKEMADKGETTQSDVDYTEIELLSVQNKLLYLKENNRYLKKNLFEKIGSDLDSETYFKDIPYINNEKIVVNDYKIMEKKAEIELENENLKYEKRKNQPEFETALYYDIENDTWNINFNMNTDMFDYKISEKQKNIDIEKLNIEKTLIEQEVDMELKKYKMELENLRNNISLLEKDMKVKKERFNMIKKMYMKGYINIREYMETRREARDSEYSYRKTLNQYNTLNYKIKIIK